VALAAVSSACSVYDDTLTPGSRIAQVRETAGRGHAGSAAAGDAGYSSDVRTGTEAGRAAGSSGGAAGGAAKADLCGNAKLDGNESCDLAIQSGLPGACPTACSSKDACVRARLEGTACQARCVFAAPSCADADGCCPSDCTPTNDSDCSASCGDGIVQKDLGETCETTPGVAAELACPSEQSCQSDNACVRVLLKGSASNCNLRCERQTVTNAQNDDGCCPAGGNANVDSDCQPKCGNGVREAAEACDGGESCGSDCKLLQKPVGDMCLNSLGDGACERCECENCVAEVSACVASGDTKRDANCHAVEACATKHDCAGTGCYCGGALLFCAINPLGACVPEIERAANSQSWITIQAQYSDAKSALGRAQALGECRRNHCQNVCP
jgi:hypothetical protein